MPESIEVRELLSVAVRQLHGESARVDAELLLAHVLDRSRTWLYAHPEARLDLDGVAHMRFEQLVSARMRGEPVAYLIGRRDFWSMSLHVNNATLIPRPETELLVELALQRIAHDRPASVVDLGTGSGAIALAIAGERPLAQVLAVDASADALDVARDNAEALNASGGERARIEWLQSDWFSAAGGRRFDVVVGNPPYLAEDDPHLRSGELRFEPVGALVSGMDGLDAIRLIVVAAPRHLCSGGWLLLEHGWTQGAAVRALLSAAGFDSVTTHHDLEDRERVSLGRHK